MISLERLPSHGRAVAKWLWSAQYRRVIPVVFVGGRRRQRRAGARAVRRRRVLRRARARRRSSAGSRHPDDALGGLAEVLRRPVRERLRRPARRQPRRARRRRPPCRPSGRGRRGARGPVRRSTARRRGGAVPGALRHQRLAGERQECELRVRLDHRTGVARLLDLEDLPAQRVGLGRQRRLRPAAPRRRWARSRLARVGAGNTRDDARPSSRFASRSDARPPGPAGRPIGMSTATQAASGIGGEHVAQRRAARPPRGRAAPPPPSRRGSRLRRRREP